MDYLVFRLYGPMVSWGDIAVGQSRHTAVYPSKSAVLGLLGAALGVRREDEDAQSKLATGYSLATKVLKSGWLLKDYHTSQVPDSVGKFQYRTRRDEIVIGRERLGTILSSREYRADAHAIVAVKVNENAFWKVDFLRSALKKPKFHLYMGRKSCPLAAPLDVQIIRAGTYREALDMYKPGELLIGEPIWNGDDRWLPEEKITHYYWEGKITDFSEDREGFLSTEIQELIRHDQPLSRKRWQFQPRLEYLWLHRREVC